MRCGCNHPSTGQVVQSVPAGTATTALLVFTNTYKTMSEELYLTDIDTDDYSIITKNTKDILNDMNFEDEDDRYMCYSIINNLEKFASDSIRAMKIVSLPFIGCLRISPVRRKLRDTKLHLHNIRQAMTKEEYKEYVTGLVKEWNEEQREADAEKLLMTKIKRNNKKKYEELYKKLGRAYANMYIKAIRLLDYVPFDLEWEEHYQELKDKSSKEEDIEKHTETQEDINKFIKSQPRFKF